MIPTLKGSSGLRTVLVGWSLAFCLFLGLAAPRLHQPVTDDEIYEVRNAERLLAGEQIHLYVPPVYDLFLAGTMYVAGNGDAALRLPGLICAALTLGLTWWLAAQLSLGGAQRLLCLVLLATSPAFVQGALLVHIDNTLLVVTCLAFVVASLRWWEAPETDRLRSAMVSSVVLALALLVKFSTPLLMVAGIGAALLWRARERVFGFAGIAAGGCLLFLLLWYGLAAWLQLDPLEPFLFVSERVDRQRAGWMTWVATWTRNMATLAVWMTPWLLAGCVWASRRARQLGMERVLLGAAGLAVFIYLPLTAINHGFPKYYMPALPLLVILVVDAAGRSYGRAMAVTTIIVALFLILFGQEPVYFLRFELRQLLIDGQDPIGGVLRQGAMWVGALVLVSVAARLSAWRPVRVSNGLLVLCMAGGLSTSVQQSLAGYQTNYSYGERGTALMLSHLRDRLRPQDRVIATQDVLYRLERRDEVLPDSVWVSPVTLSRLIASPTTAFVVVSVPSQSRALMTALQQSPLRDALAGFDLLQIGTYQLYQRRR